MMAKDKMSDTEFGLSMISPAFALSKVASGDANIGDFGVMGAMKRFGGGGDKVDPNTLTDEERQQLRAMLAQQGKPIPPGMKRGGVVKKSMPMKKMASGGRVRGDGCAIKGKTKGRIV